MNNENCALKLVDEIILSWIMDGAYFLSMRLTALSRYKNLVYARTYGDEL